MINAYSRGVGLDTNGIVPFNSVTLEKGCSTVMSGASTIALKKQGVYKVEFNAEAVAGSAGDVTIGMLTNGVAKSGDTVTVSGATVSSGVTVPIVTLVQVKQSDCRCNCGTTPTTIQFINSGVAVTGDFNVVVTKLC